MLQAYTLSFIQSVKLQNATNARFCDVNKILDGCILWNATIQYSSRRGPLSVDKLFLPWRSSDLMNKVGNKFHPHSRIFYMYLANTMVHVNGNNNNNNNNVGIQFRTQSWPQSCSGGARPSRLAGSLQVTSLWVKGCTVSGHSVQPWVMSLLTRSARGPIHKKTYDKF